MTFLSGDSASLATAMTGISSLVRNLLFTQWVVAVKRELPVFSLRRDEPYQGHTSCVGVWILYFFLLFPPSWRPTLMCIGLFKP